MSRLLSLLAAVAVLVASLGFFATPAAAHESRMLGPYRVVVGWIGEPAFVGQMNAVDFRVTDTRVTPAKPVEGLEKTLSVEVFSGGLSTGFKATFRTRFGLPGQYAADVLPTREGSYKFVVTGKIDTLEVKETFESGPGRFDEIRPVSALQYPATVPVGEDLTKRIAEVQGVAEQTRLAALAALALGVVAVALAFRRRRA